MPKTTISVTMDPELLAVIDKQAKKEKLSRSAWLADAAEEKLNRIDNPTYR